VGSWLAGYFGTAKKNREASGDPLHGSPWFRRLARKGRQNHEDDYSNKGIPISRSPPPRGETRKKTWSLHVSPCCLLKVSGRKVSARSLALPQTRISIPTISPPPPTPTHHHTTYFHDCRRPRGTAPLSPSGAESGTHQIAPPGFDSGVIATLSNPAC
jgi:hypothetical protein